MIVQRIYVKGFLSYRDEAELCFEGAALWLLSGRNGAGKSAIFDAITYALYGRHRGEGRAVKDLINKHADNLLVEVDFTVDGSAYRVRRTAGRRANSGFQAWRLTPAPQVVAETDNEAGLQRWVQHTIGLDFNAFTAAVLLQQGKSDALLQADPKARHGILSQIVDLSAYERLAAGAADHERTYRERKEVLAQQVAGLEPVEQATLDDLAARLDELDAARDAMQRRCERIAAWKVEAARWQRLSGEAADLQQRIEGARTVLAQAARIRADADRHRDLEHAVPALERLHAARERLALCKATIAELTAQEQRAQHDHERARAAVLTVTAAVASLYARRDTWRNEFARAQQELADLAEPLAEIKRLEVLCADLRRLDDRLAAFPADLDEQVAAAAAAIAELDALDVADPWLGHLIAARERMECAESRRRDLKEHLVCLDQDAETVGASCQAAETALEAARADLDARKEEATRAATLLEQARQRRQRFDEIDTRPICESCGQPLTPEHLAAERARRQAELDSTQRAWETARQRQCEVEAALTTCKAAYDDHARRLRELRAAQETARRQLEESERAITEASERATDALTNVPLPLRQALGDATDIAYLCGVQQTWATRRRERPTRAAELQVLRDRAREREGLETRRRTHLDEEAALAARYTAEQITYLRAAQAMAAQRAAFPRRELDRLAPELARLEAEASASQEAAACAENAWRDATRELDGARIRHEEALRGEGEVAAAVPDGWRAVTETLDEARLQALRDERAALASAPAALEGLEIVERDHAQWERDLQRIEGERATIPVEARHPRDLLDLEEHDAQRAWEETDAERSEVQRERDTLLTRRAQREALARQQAEAERLHALYRTLAGLLGRDGLQRHLLQQAEARIVEAANGVLDRISSGTLRLALKSAANGGAARALDLVAYQTIEGVRTELGVAYLSGSQQFRVAVSLALGIGQYASGGGRGVESVIIDEGFGSLDREGRREMIEQFHALKEVLRRIVLVSHQEEFATAFSNGYRIWQEGGSSRAALLDV